MNKRLLLVFITLCVFRTDAASQGSNDTARYPYWMEMMRAPDANYFQVKRAFDLYWGDSVPERGYGYKVFKRWEWRVRDKILPDGTIQWNRGALNESGYNGKSDGQPDMEGMSTPCPAQGRWTAVGPYKHPYNQSGQPTGIGRINGFAFHPKDSNTLYALAPQGGIWKTTDNGRTWAHIFGKNPVVNTIGVSSMVISYNNADTMYIGTGDRDAGDAPGMGVLWSTNGGRTWATRNSGITNLTIAKMVLHPRNSAILVIATNGGMYRSTNSGQSWTRTATGSFTDVVIHPRNPHLIYATRGGLFFRSTDNGQTWTQVTTGLPTSSRRGQIAVSRANANYVYFVTTTGASLQGFYRSTDSGLTFSTRSTSPNILGYYSGTGTDSSSGQGWYDIDIDADPGNAEVVYVGGINIWKSTNGGTNWTQVANWVGAFNADDIHADQHAIDFNITGNKLYSGNDGGVYYTWNAGSRWVNISTGIQNSQIYRIAHAQTDEFIGAQGYQDNGSSQTTRDEFYTYYGGDGMDCQVDPKDASFVYGSYVGGRIYRAIDKNLINTIGANGTGGINENGAWLTPYILQEGQPGTMFAGYTNVWRTTAAKTGTPPSWTSLSAGFGGIRHLENSPARNSILYALESNLNIRRTDNATSASVSWVNLGSGPGGVRWIEAHHKDSNRVYCVNGNNLYRSNNKGSTWTSIATPSGAGLLNVCYIDTSSKTELIYIGTERGIYIWDSLGNQIINYNNQFPVWSDVTDIDIWHSPRGREQSKILVSTYGSGVWRSNLYDPGTLKPVASFYTFDSVLTSGGKVRLYEKISGSTASHLWKITPYHFSYTDGTDSTSYAPSVQFNKKGLYTIRLIAGNCFGSDTFMKASWMKVFDKPANPLCRNTTTYSTNNYMFGLFRFSLADNGSETGGYFDDGENIDFTSNKVFRLKPGTSYTLTAKSGPYYSEFIRLYIDYNGDGRFQNFRGEVGPTTSRILGSKTLSFTTPASPTLRNTGLRFRLLSDYNALDTNACRNLGYGQGEDYTFVFDMPIPYFTSNKLSACVGETITFTDTTEGFPDRWEWDFGSGATPRTAQGRGPHQVRYTATGTKSVRLRINGKDSVRKNAYINITTAPDPVVVIKNGSSTGCQGRNLTLALRNRNGVPVQFQWQKDGVNLAGKTDSILVLSNLTPADSGIYTGVLINGTCRATSAGYRVIVYYKPKAAFSINSNPQCLKNNRFILANNSTITNGSLTYLWSFGDGTSTALTNPVKTYTTTGTYGIRLIASSNNNCRDTANASVTVNPSPSAAFSLSNSAQCLRGNNFTTINSSTGAIAYNWNFGDGTTSTAVAPAKTYSSANLYTIRLIALNSQNCSDTFNRSVTVHPQPIASFALNSSSQCLRGNNFIVTNNSSGASSYAWNFGDGSSSSASAPAKTYSVAGTYAIRLIATSANTCSDTLSVSATVKPNPAAAFSLNNSAQCLRGNSFIANNSSTGAFSYSWSFGDGNSSTAVAPSNTYSAAGSYTIRLIALNSQNCSDTFNRSVTVHPQPSASFNLNNSGQCLRGNNFIITNNSSGASSYAWSFGDGSTSTASAPTKTYSAAGTYTIRLVATSVNNCRDTQNTTVTVFPRGVIRFSVNDSDQCLSGNSFVFTNNSSLIGGTLSYNWLFGDASSSTATSPTKNYSASGNYLVRLAATSDKGCRDTADKPVRVYATPKISFNVTSPNPQCFRGNRFSFSNTSSSADGSLTHRWTFGNGNSSVAINSSVSYAAIGDYTVKLISTSSYGCKDSVAQIMSVKANPRSQFTINDSDQCLSGNLFTFNNQSGIAAGSISSRVWDYGDGTSSSQVAPNKTYISRGTYTISLISISNWGCRDTTSRSIRVYGQSNVSFAINAVQQCLKGNRFEFYNNSSAGDGTLSYRWTFGDGNSTTGATPVYRYSAHGAYQVKLLSTSSFGCKDSISAGLNVLPQADISFSVNDSDQCQLGNTFSITNKSNIVAGFLSYYWYWGDGTTSRAIDPVKSYSTFGIYPVSLITLTDKGCRDTMVKTVRVYAMPVSGFSVTPAGSCLRDNKFQSDNTGTISEGSFSTTWKNGDGSNFSGTSNKHSYNQAGAYSIVQILKSNFGCLDSTIRQVVVHPMPRAAFSVSPGDLCEGEGTYTTNLSTISTGTIQYNWNFGNGYVKSGDTASVAYRKHGRYSIQLAAESDKGCRDTAGYDMQVASVPAANFTVTPNPACAIQNVLTFNNSSSNADGNSLNHQWQLGDGSTSKLAIPTYTYSNSGKYTTVLTASNGKCTDTAQVPVTIVPNVSAAFTHEAITKETLLFRAIDTTEPGYLYQWNFGDKSSGDGPKTLHQYKENGNYRISLYVENSLGCRDSSAANVLIFSPNYVDQDNGASFYAYPNPNSGTFSYKFRITQQQTVHVKLYTILGQQPVYTATWENAAPGNYFDTVDLRKLQLSAGTYPLLVFANGQQYLVKIIYLGD